MNKEDSIYGEVQTTLKSSSSNKLFFKQIPFLCLRNDEIDKQILYKQNNNLGVSLKNIDKLLMK